MAKILKEEELKKRMDLKTRVQSEDRPLLNVYRSSSVVSKEVLTAQNKARDLLEEAKSEAVQIKKEAKELLDQVQDEMEKSRKQAEEWGFQDGLAQALEYLQKIHLLREKMFENLEPQIVELAFSIAEKVIREKIQKNDEAVFRIVKQALEAVLGYKVLVRLNPADYKRLKTKQALLLEKIDSSKTISFKEDSKITEGGCVVESEIGAIDAQLDTQLLAIKKVLGL